MPETTPTPTYDEILAELRKKIEFLYRRYRYEQKEVAAKIKERPNNLSDILTDAKQCSRKKALKLLDELNNQYGEDLVGWSTPQQYSSEIVSSESEDSLVKPNYSVLEKKVEDLRIQIEALARMFLEFRAGSEGIPIEKLVEEFNRIKAELAQKAAS